MGMARIAVACAFAGAMIGVVETADAARMARHDGRPIEIMVAPKKTTQIVSNDAMTELVTSLQRHSLSIEQMGGRLIIVPLDKVEGDIVLQMEGGDVITLRLVTVDARQADDSVYLYVQNEAMKKSAAKTKEWDASDMLRTMVRVARGYDPGAPAGVEERKTSGVYEEGPLVMEKIRRFVASRYDGIVLRVVNRANRSVVMSLPRLTFDGMILSAAEREELAAAGTPSSETYLYVVRAATR